MEKILKYLRMVCMLVISASVAVIAYSQYEGMKAQRVQAVAAVMAQDDTVKALAKITSFNLISAGFPVKDVYEHIYCSETLVKNAQVGKE